MPQSMQILAVSHQIQGPGFRSYVDDPAYSQWIKNFLAEGTDLIFEEARGRGPSVAENVAKGKRIEYLDIDPAPSDRHKFGIPEHTSGGGGIDPLHSRDAYEYVTIEAQVKRDEVWLQRIRSQKFQNGLVICGIAHGLSFGVKLDSNGFGSKGCTTTSPTVWSVRTDHIALSRDATGCWELTRLPTKGTVPLNCRQSSVCTESTQSCWGTSGRTRKTCLEMVPKLLTDAREKRVIGFEVLC